MTKALKEILPTIFKEQTWKFQLFQNWDTIFGPISKKVCIEKIFDDTIILGVYNSCWLQELYFLSHVLIKAINEKLDKPRIKKVRFKIAGIKKQHDKKNIKTKKYITPKKVTLSFGEEQALTKIDDVQLSNALKNFLIRCYQEKE